MNTTAPRFRCLGCSHTFRADSLPTGPEGCPECGGGHFEELPISPLPCPAGCDEGRALSRDGSHSFACAACRGSGVARCEGCGERPAVHEDGEVALCVGCLAEVRADEERERAGAAGAALVLLAVACGRQLVAERIAVAALRVKLGLGTWRPTPVDARIAFCSMQDLGSCSCPMCTGAPPRHCTPPPPPAFVPPMPPLARRDPDSSTWRAVAQTAVATVAP